MAGTKLPSKKDVRTPSSAARSAGSDQGSSDATESGSQQQSIRGSKGPGSGAVTSDSVQGPSMRNNSSKGTLAAATDERHGATVARDSELMLLASEIIDLKVIHKHILSNKLTGQKELDARLQGASGLPLQAARLFSLRLRINEALTGPGGAKRFVSLRVVCQELCKLTEESAQRSFNSITAYAMMAFCLAESLKEGDDSGKAALTAIGLLHGLRSRLGWERNGTIDSSGWLDPKLEMVIDPGSKASHKILDKMEGGDMTARIKSKLAFIDTILKQLSDTEGPSQQENKMQDLHNNKREAARSVADKYQRVLNKYQADIEKEDKSSAKSFLSMAKDRHTQAVQYVQAKMAGIPEGTPERVNAFLQLFQTPIECLENVAIEQLNKASTDKKVALKAEVQEHVRSTCASGRFVHWKASPDVDRWLLDQQRAVYTEASFMESLKLHAKHPENSGREDAVGDAAAAGGKGLSGTASRSSSLDEPSSVVGQPLHQLRAAFPGFHALHSAMLNHISPKRALYVPHVRPTLGIRLSTADEGENNLIKDFLESAPSPAQIWSGDLGQWMDMAQMDDAMQGGHPLSIMSKALDHAFLSPMLARSTVKNRVHASAMLQHQQDLVVQSALNCMEHTPWLIGIEAPSKEDTFLISYWNSLSKGSDAVDMELYPAVLELMEKGEAEDVDLYTSHVVLGYAILLLSRGLLTPAYRSMPESARREPVLQLFRNILTNTLDITSMLAMVQQKTEFSEEILKVVLSGKPLPQQAPPSAPPGPPPRASSTDAAAGSAAAVADSLQQGPALNGSAAPAAKSKRTVPQTSGMGGDSDSRRSVDSRGDPDQPCPPAHTDSGDASEVAGPERHRTAPASGSVTDSGATTPRRGDANGCLQKTDGDAAPSFRAPGSNASPSKDLCPPGTPKRASGSKDGSPLKPDLTGDQETSASQLCEVTEPATATAVAAPATVITQSEKARKKKSAAAANQAAAKEAEEAQRREGEVRTHQNLIDELSEVLAVLDREGILSLLMWSSLHSQLRRWLGREECSDVFGTSVPASGISSDPYNLVKLFSQLPDHKLHLLRVQLLAIAGLHFSCFVSTAVFASDGFEGENACCYSMWETTPPASAPDAQTPKAHHTSQADPAPLAAKAGKKGKGHDSEERPPQHAEPSSVDTPANASKAGKKGGKGQDKEESGQPAASTTGGSAKGALSVVVAAPSTSTICLSLRSYGYLCEEAAQGLQLEPVLAKTGCVESGSTAGGNQLKEVLEAFCEMPTPSPGTALGESMALRALAGLSDQTSPMEAIESPLIFKNAITMMSKSALCAWWHAKIMRRAQEQTLLMAQYREISPCIRLFMRTMDRQHQGAAQFQRLAPGWRDGYIPHMRDVGDEDRPLNGGHPRSAPSQHSEIAWDVMSHHQHLLVSLLVASLETSHTVLILRLSRLLELREDKVEALKSSREELDQGKKELSNLRQPESTSGKQEGSEAARQGRNHLRLREKYRAVPKDVTAAIRAKNLHQLEIRLDDLEHAIQTMDVCKMAIGKEIDRTRLMLAHLSDRTRLADPCVLLEGESLTYKDYSHRLRCWIASLEELMLDSESKAAVAMLSLSYNVDYHRLCFKSVWLSSLLLCAHITVPYDVLACREAFRACLYTTLADEQHRVLMEESKAIKGSKGSAPAQNVKTSTASKKSKNKKGKSTVVVKAGTGDSRSSSDDDEEEQKTAAQKSEELAAAAANMARSAGKKIQHDASGNIILNWNAEEEEEESEGLETPIGVDHDGKDNWEVHEPWAAAPAPTGGVKQESGHDSDSGNDDEMKAIMAASAASYEEEVATRLGRELPGQAHTAAAAAAARAHKHSQGVSGGGSADGPTDDGSNGKSRQRKLNPNSVDALHEHQGVGGKGSTGNTSQRQSLDSGVQQQQQQQQGKKNSPMSDKLPAQVIQQDPPQAGAGKKSKKSSDKAAAAIPLPPGAEYADQKPAPGAGKSGKGAGNGSSREQPPSQGLEAAAGGKKAGDGGGKKQERRQDSRSAASASNGSRSSPAVADCDPQEQQSVHHHAGGREGQGLGWQDDSTCDDSTWYTDAETIAYQHQQASPENYDPHQQQQHQQHHNTNDNSRNSASLSQQEMYLQEGAHALPPQQSPPHDPNAAHDQDRSHSFLCREQCKARYHGLDPESRALVLQDAARIQEDLDSCKTDVKALAQDVVWGRVQLVVYRALLDGNVIGHRHLGDVYLAGGMDQVALLVVVHGLPFERIQDMVADGIVPDSVYDACADFQQYMAAPQGVLGHGGWGGSELLHSSNSHSSGGEGAWQGQQQQTHLSSAPEPAQDEDDDDDEGDFLMDLMTLCTDQPKAAVNLPQFLPGSTSESDIRMRDRPMSTINQQHHAGGETQPWTSPQPNASRFPLPPPGPSTYNPNNGGNAPARLGGPWGQGPPSVYTPNRTPRVQQMQPAVGSVLPLAVARSSNTARGTGLVNRTGEYNCFLNVIIQCLWHLPGFSNALTAKPASTYLGHDVVQALAGLFRALEGARDHQNIEGGARATVDPNELREALDAQPGQKFSIGEMSDPSEVLMAVYECMAKVPTLKMPVAGVDTPVVDIFFGLRLHEALHCSTCNVVSHEMASHVEYYLIIQATALRALARTEGAHCSMGHLLHVADNQCVKYCDKDKQGCNQPGTPRKTLELLPQVLTLLLAWEADVRADDIRATMAAVNETCRASDIFPGSCPLGRDEYTLRAMFCYYGQHYHAFIYSEAQNLWVMYDDSNVNNVGGWEDVLKKCHTGRIQPLVLFYSKAG